MQQNYAQNTQEPLETIAQREKRHAATQKPTGLIGVSYIGSDGPCVQRDGAKELLLRQAFNLRQEAAGLDALANSLPTLFTGEAEFALYKILTK